MSRAYLIAILLLSSVCLQHHTLLLTSFQEIPGDLGDARLVHYLLEFSYQSLFKGTSIWNPNYFYPAQDIGAYTDVLPGVLPWYVPFRLLGLDPGFSFQFWLITTTALNFLCALYLFDSFSKNSPTSLFAAFLFTIASPRTAQLTHPQLLFAGYCLLFVGALVRLSTSLKKGDIRVHTITASCSLALQCYSGFYNTWSLFFVVSVAGIICVLFPSTREKYITPAFANTFQTPITALLSSSIFFLSALPFYFHAKAAAHTVGFRSFGEVHAALPRLIGWINQGPFSLLYGWLAELEPFSLIQVEHENRLGFGLVSSSLFLLSIWQQRKNRFAQILLVIFFVIVAMITVFPGDHTFWHYPYLYLPGTAAVRAVGRVSLLLFVIPSFFLAATLIHMVGRKQRTLGIIALCLIALEQIHIGPNYDKTQSKKDIQQLVDYVRRHPEKCQSFFFVVMRGKFPTAKYHIDAMWAALESEVLTINGYSGNYPPHWELAHINVPSKSELASLSNQLVQWKAISRIDTQTCMIVKESQRPLRMIII